MLAYLSLIATTMILVWAIKRTRFGLTESVGNRNKNKICYLLVFLLLTFFIGLRTQYNDTEAYVKMYEQAIKLPKLWKNISFSPGDNPGFVLVQSLMKTIGFSAQDFLLFFSAFSMLCSLIFIKRYTSNFALSLFLFFANNIYTLSAAAIKQSAAIAIGLIAIMYAEKKKWKRFWIVLFIAATFHPYVLLYGIVPFLTFKPWTRRTYLLITAALVAGLALEAFLGTIVDVTSLVGDSYSADKLTDEGISVFRVLVCNVVLILTYMYRNRLFGNSSESDNLMVNLAMVNGAIMFVGAFGTAIYFSRLANYFTISQCIALPWIVERVSPGYRKFFKYAMIIGYSGFFIYANMITQSFDLNFSRMTLMEYLKNYAFR